MNTAHNKMETDDLKTLFDNFNPELSDSKTFMDTLSKQLKAVDAVKADARAMRSMNRKAVAVAAAVGFVAGVLFTLLVPLAANWLSGIILGLKHASAEQTSTISSTLCWLIAAAGTSMAALQAYDFTMWRLGYKKQTH